MMTEAFVMTFAQNALLVTLILAGPILAVSLIVGIVVSMIQSATSINEVTLTFVPKIIGVGLVLALMGSWMGQQLLTFTVNLFASLPNLPR
jgi:flagellar biosynthetic protein FliQ